MEGHTKISILMLIIAAAFNHAKTSNTKEARKVGLLIPEKIIGGVIDIVHSHKHKPTAGQTTQQQTQISAQQIYQPAPGYQPQYPNYQYPPAPNQGAYQSQYQSQFQNGYNPGYQPQNGGNYQNYPPSYPPQNSGPVYQGPMQPTYGSSQSQLQNQYQGGYPQNQGNQYQNQNQQSSGQYQNQNQQQTSVQYNQNQQTGQYQTGNQQTTGQYQTGNQQTTGQYQTGNQQTTGQYHNQNQQNNQFQGSQNQQSGGQFIGQGSGGQGGGFQISAGQQSGGPGPTCVCQAWTKPETTAEVPSQKVSEKSEDSTSE